MKHQGLDIYKNTAKGDVIASAPEARKAIQRHYLMMIGRGRKAYWVIEKSF